MPTQVCACRVTLVEAAEILGSFDSRMREYAAGRLHKQGVELIQASLHATFVCEWVCFCLVLTQLCSKQHGCKAMTASDTRLQQQQALKHRLWCAGAGEGAQSHANDTLQWADTGLWAVRVVHWSGPDW